jgi:hypothetical protein
MHVDDYWIKKKNCFKIDKIKNRDFKYKLPTIPHITNNYVYGKIRVSVCVFRFNESDRYIPAIPNDSYT